MSLQVNPQRPSTASNLISDALTRIAYGHNELCAKVSGLALRVEDLAQRISTQPGKRTIAKPPVSLGGTPFVKVDSESIRAGLKAIAGELPGGKAGMEVIWQKVNSFNSADPETGAVKLDTLSTWQQKHTEFVKANKAQLIEFFIDKLPAKPSTNDATTQNALENLFALCFGERLNYPDDNVFNDDLSDHEPYLEIRRAMPYFVYQHKSLVNWDMKSFVGALLDGQFRDETRKTFVAKPDMLDSMVKSGRDERNRTFAGNSAYAFKALIDTIGLENKKALAALMEKLLDVMEFGREAIEERNKKLDLEAINLLEQFNSSFAEEADFKTYVMGREEIVERAREASQIASELITSKLNGIGSSEQDDGSLLNLNSKYDLQNRQTKIAEAVLPYVYTAVTMEPCRIDLQEQIVDAYCSDNANFNLSSLPAQLEGLATRESVSLGKLILDLLVGAVDVENKTTDLQYLVAIGKLADAFYEQNELAISLKNAPAEEGK